MMAQLGLQPLGRASLLCPSISDFDLLSDGERIVDLNPEVTNRALEFGMPERS
jgi:hypothetical protein